MTKKTPLWQADFVGHLAQLVKDKDRATLAQLRRGLAKDFGQESRRDGWVLSQLRRMGRANFTDEWEVNRCCQIASLFAEHPVACHYGTLGTSFREMANQPGANEESIERRFHALLDSDYEDLPDRLRHAVSLLKAKNVAVNWAQLLTDLGKWTLEWRPVHKDWSRDFWAPRKTKTDGAAGESAEAAEAATTPNA